MPGIRLPHAQKRQDVDMTEGSILHHIISFALPLLLGNLFQQFYNMVDTWVVGNFASNEAYSAVGTVGPVINTLIGFFTGLASGAGVVISQYYGAGRHDRVQQAVHTSIVITLIFGVFFTFIGIVGVPLMLNLMKMPTEVQPEATTYLSIYFGGILTLMMYNMGAGILRAVGDSKRPFYFLVVCAIMNTVLDLVFVIVLGWGVAGVAIATVLSQLVSAVLTIITLLRTNSCVKLSISKLQIHWDILKKIFSVGIPAALQLAITSFSNVFVQSYINDFGTECMSGWTTYTKVDQLLFLPMQSIALASTTFVGQNLGKNLPKRARQGVNVALVLSLFCTLILMAPVIIFASPLAAFFNAEPAVVEKAALFLRWLTPFYILSCANQIYAGALRGAGDARAPMVIMLCTFVGFRQLYLFVMSQVCKAILPIAMCYPAGWLLCSVITGIYYHKVQITKNRLVE